MAFLTGNVNSGTDILSIKFNFLFEWEIDNFCNKCKVERVLESPKFTNSFDDEIQWHMRLCKKEFFLRLYLNTSASVNKASECFFVIRNNTGDVLAETNVIDKSEVHPESFGFVTFSPRNCTKNSLDVIINCDNIKIMGGLRIVGKEKRLNFCDQVMYMGSPILLPCKDMDQLERQQDDDLSRLAVIAKYEALFKDEKFSDVSLMAEDKILKVHKCILANTSSVFSAMFDAEMKEKRENIVEITDIKYDVLVEMVRYIYTGKVDDMDTLAGELAVAADRYALDGLKNSCEKWIARNLSIDNVVHCFQLADGLYMDKLKEKTIKFMVENARNITDKPEFQLLPNEIVHKVCRY